MHLNGVSPSFLVFVFGGSRMNQHMNCSSFLLSPVMRKRKTTTNLFQRRGDDDYSRSCPITTNTTTTTLEVCTSPGCVADGADEAIIKLQALTSMSSSSSLDYSFRDNNIVVVKSGVCCSLCGNGPIVIDTNSGKIHRKVLSSDKKILEVVLSLNDENENEINVNINKALLLDGINLCFNGDKALKSKDYAGAIEKYSNGIDIGMENPAIISLINEQQQQNNNQEESNGGNDDEESNDDNTTKMKEQRKERQRLTNNSGLNWLINAHSNQARSRLQSRDIDGAIATAELGYKLSMETSIESSMILQEAYQQRSSTTRKYYDDDIRREFDVLQSLFDLLDEIEQQYINKKKEKKQCIKHSSANNNIDANKRRTLDFRFKKLQTMVVKK
mmetsp:Transcript_4142/g.4269  ORF Transcript_4142/g.4269 Transcript_4142/m.4269 type:complete len:387 (+) Transcript_4142:1488-2648(+)